MSKLISFSVFSKLGKLPKYLIGIQRNLELAKIVYPGWKCRVYLEQDLEVELKDKLEKLEAEVIIKPHSINYQGYMWRFLVCEDAQDYWIVRDCDSRLTIREKNAVDEWIASGLPFHIMHEHYCHKHVIMGGAFGGYKNIIKNIARKIEIFQKAYSNLDDEAFLADLVYPEISYRAFYHDRVKLEVPGDSRFSLLVPSSDKSYILQRIDENNKPIDNF